MATKAIGLMESPFPPEIEEGNVEYKRKLSRITENRFRKLATQMLFRLKEGEGEAIYLIGIEDDGSLSKTDKRTLRTSLRILKHMTRFLDASIESISRISLEDHTYLKVVVRKEIRHEEEELPSLDF